MQINDDDDDDDKRVGSRWNYVIPWKRVPYLSASVMGLAHKEALDQVSSTFTFSPFSKTLLSIIRVY